jgi:truncated hemoglobin YjbI
MSQWVPDNQMRPSGNFSDNATFNQSNAPDMGRSFPGMKPSGNTSDGQPANMGNVSGGSKLSTEEYLQQAVDSGTITQAEADAITAWINAMPDAMTKLGAFQHNGHMGLSDMDFYSPPF